MLIRVILVQSNLSCACKVGCIPAVVESGLLLSHRENRYSTGKAGNRSSVSPLGFFYTVVTPIHQTLLDGIEMLHFRSTVALKELFQTPLKGPLTGRVGAVKAAPAASACFSSTVSLDGRSPGRGRAFAGWRAPPPPPHFTRRHAVRGFCSKGDGQNEAGKDASAEK